VTAIGACDVSFGSAREGIWCARRVHSRETSARRRRAPSRAALRAGLFWAGCGVCVRGRMHGSSPWPGAIMWARAGTRSIVRLSTSSSASQSLIQRLRSPPFSLAGVLISVAGAASTRCWCRAALPGKSIARCAALFFFPPSCRDMALHPRKHRDAAAAVQFS
jgi:hypothetical protein